MKEIIIGKHPTINEALASELKKEKEVGDNDLERYHDYWTSRFGIFPNEDDYGDDDYNYNIGVNWEQDDNDFYYEQMGKKPKKRGKRGRSKRKFKEYDYDNDTYILNRHKKKNKKEKEIYFFKNFIGDNMNDIVSQPPDEYFDTLDEFIEYCGINDIYITADELKCLETRHRTYCSLSPEDDKMLITDCSEGGLYWRVNEMVDAD